jgi:hypothetical protein
LLSSREETLKKKEKEMLEIALKTLVWRFRQLGTERFMGELKAVVEDTDIQDEKMLEFLKYLSDNT